MDDMMKEIVKKDIEKSKKNFIDNNESQQTKISQANKNEN